MEKEIIKAFRSLQAKVENIDISEKINSELKEIANDQYRSRKKVPFFLKAVLASAAIISTILIFNLFKLKTDPGSKIFLEKEPQVLELKYAHISGKETKRYYFKSDNQNKMIVWLQKKGD